ncbi:hypothetical protein QFC19_000588 [Naganishia cerealis]|uniref:Uncharacterized protein n=1 Tax=Naganishia cerealis TaxID=610337 RepID=A0ACC2WP33_9TREE|nr:hypothetical protein QFC19_000588 [Naganishia cerealis]
MTGVRPATKSLDGSFDENSTSNSTRPKGEDTERKTISQHEALSSDSAVADEVKDVEREDVEADDDSDTESPSDDEGTSDGSSGTDESDSETTSNVSFPAAPTPKNTHIEHTASTFSASDDKGNSLAVHPDYADVFGSRQPIEAARTNSSPSSSEVRHGNEVYEGMIQPMDLGTKIPPNICPLSSSPLPNSHMVSSVSIGMESLSNTSVDHHYTPSSLRSSAPLLSTFPHSASASSMRQLSSSVGIIGMNSKGDMDIEQPRRAHASVRIQAAAMEGTQPSPHGTTTFSSGGAYLGSIFSRRSSESGGLSMTPEEKQRERDQKRLEQLGYSQVLGRDYGFWSNFAVGFCNIGVSNAYDHWESLYWALTVFVSVS